LRDVAANFQQYEFKGIVFHYIPSSGSVASGTNPALGTVMFQTSYRSNDTAPTSKLEMMNEYWSNEVVPFETTCHPIECDPKENPFAIHYIRTGPIPSGDQLLYDLGVTYIAVSGQQANDNVLGDIWVTYEVELKKPLISSNVTALRGYVATNFASPTATAFFDGAQVTTPAGNLQLTYAARTITIPVGLSGIFVIHLNIKSAAGLSGAAVNWTGTSALTNCALALGMLDVASSDWYSDQPNTTATVSLRYSIAVNKVDPSLVATVALPAAVWTGGTTSIIGVSISQLQD
jgi:hypothetical protein